MPPKRKRSSVVAADLTQETRILPLAATARPAINRRATKRGKVDTNPDHNGDIVDGKAALRASPDADEPGESMELGKAINGPPTTPPRANGMNEEDGNQSPQISNNLDIQTTDASDKKTKKSPTKSSIAAKKASDEIKAFKVEQAAKKAAGVRIKQEDGEDEWDKRLDPDGDEVGPAEDADAIKLEARRPPPVNSDYLPLPWKGRLGYVCISQKLLIILLTSSTGMFKYILKALRSTSLYFADMPHSFYS